MTVYRFDAPARYDLPDEAVEQLRLGHQLRNELVAIERRYAEAVEATWGLYPALAETEAAVVAADEAIEAMVAEAQQERKKDRTTVPRAATKAALAEARRVLRDAKAARRDAKARLYPQAKERLLTVRQARDGARKALYADFVQGRGLYWATYNDVSAKHEASVKRVAEQRKQGRPADLRFHRWDGSGTLTVQLQRGSGQPARTPALLASGEGPWRNVFQVGPWVDPAEWEAMGRPERRDVSNPAPRGRGGAVVSIGQERRIEVPLTVHRMLPAGADMSQAQVTRRLVAGRARVSVTVTARIDAPGQSAGALVALHVGWRSMGDGSLRTAVVTADRPLAAPRDGVPVRRVQHGWEVRLPAEARRRFGRAEELRSVRDKALDVLREDVAVWLAEHPVEGLDAATVRRWRSPARFAALAYQWREGPPDVEMAARLEAWRSQDKHLWSWEAHQRRKAAVHVRELWRLVAAWLSGQAAVVAVDGSDLRSLSRVPPVGDEDSSQGRAARSQRQEGSPGELRAAVSAAAERDGAEVVKVDPAGTTTVHAGCGAALGGDRAKQVTLWCPACSHGVDQDLNAAEHLLAAASAPVAAEPPGSARSRVEQGR